MERLTLEETQRRYKEMWLWIAKETRKQKRKVEKVLVMDLTAGGLVTVPLEDFIKGDWE